MKVPPFCSNTILTHCIIPQVLTKPCRQQNKCNRRVGRRRQARRHCSGSERWAFSCNLAVGHTRWKRGTFTRLGTRTKESNRRAREKICVCYEYFFSRTERVTQVMVCTQNECSTPTGPHAGLRLSVPVWTRKVVNYT